VIGSLAGAMIAKLMIARIPGSASTKLIGPLKLAVNNAAAVAARPKRRLATRITSFSTNRLKNTGLAARPFDPAQGRQAWNRQCGFQRRTFVTTTDIIMLVTLTGLFAAFAATMAWLETFTRRHTAVRASADTPGPRKGRPL
jgi:hypothetical protein